MAMVCKWRSHFQGVIIDALEKAGRFSFPLDFEPLEKYMSGFETLLGEGWNHVIGKDGIIVIFYDTRVGRQRQRFTIAHEWAHILQRYDGEFRADMEAIADPDERQGIIESVANYIASFYLVPHPILAQEIQEAAPKIGRGWPLAPLLAKRFDVSQQVMEIAMKNYVFRGKR